jgi:GntR family transcriptional regulator, transcriptional repressor for pyruvate dehydrogenase complex
MKSTPLSEQISSELRDEILRGRYRSGDRLPSERDLAQRFEVHRGAVREALKKLEQLGLTKIEAGGARVNPLEEASLDVVKHMMALSDPPDPRIVYEVFEATSGVMALAVRLCLERASEAEHQQACDVLRELCLSQLSQAREFELFVAFGELVAQASGNTVIMLVHRGLRAGVLGKIYEELILLDTDEQVRLERVKELARAFEAREGSAASEAAYQLVVDMRNRMTKVFEAPPVSASVSTSHTPNVNRRNLP